MTDETGSSGNVLDRWTPWLAGASAVAILFSIAVAQILLGLTIVALIAARARWRFPAIAIPVGLLFLWTLIVAATSPEPGASFALIKKFFVYGEFAVVATAIRTREQGRTLLAAIAGAGVLSALWSFVQFARKVGEADAASQDFYLYYTPNRTTGFMSHWMTFSGEMLVVLVIGCAFALWARKWWTGGAVTLVAGLALVLNQTRSVWIATAGALIYLVIAWKPKWVLALPVLALAVYALAPETIQERARSILQPHGTTDSNQHRVITLRTGIVIVKRHPFLGLRGDRVGEKFLEYLPADIPRPLPPGYYRHLHNVYLQMAAERGLPALALLIWIFVALLRDWRQLPLDPVLRHAAVATLIGTAIGAFFEHNLGNSEILHLFLAVSACAYANASSRRSDSSSLTA